MAKSNQINMQQIQLRNQRNKWNPSRTSAHKASASASAFASAVY